MSRSLQFTGVAAVLALLAACADQQLVPVVGTSDAEVADTTGAVVATDKPSLEKVELTEDEWRERLTPIQFAVLREEDTERPRTGELWDSKAVGTYRCAGCDLALFASATKFESGTGWPSYWAPIDEAHVGTKSDFAFGWIRTEAHCARCDGHLGHVFDDGPEPTGQRWCINSASLVLDSGEPTIADR